MSAPKASKASKINKGKKRQLDAFAIASHEAPEKLQIRQHRLGESFGEHPRAKRRRLGDDDEESEGEETIDSARQKQSRNVEKRTHGRKGGLDDEDVEFGSDSEGNEWTMGGMGSEESDEEIDSDEAFGESDEERFDGWTFRGSKSEKGKPKKKVVKPKKHTDDDGDLDLNEDDEEEEDEDEDSDFGGEGVDLATMLDDHDDDVLGGKDKTRKDFGEESASDEESSEGDDEQSDSSEDEDYEEPEDDER
ncbi:MAG: hypothetical protein EOP83_34325, partial [Verrucomicrobiaceae bacterium]